MKSLSLECLITALQLFPTYNFLISETVHTSLKKTQTFTCSIYTFHIMPVFEHINLISSSFRPGRIQKKANPFLLKGYLFVFETWHFRHEPAGFTWVHDCCFPGSEAGCLASEISSQGSTAPAPRGRARTQDSALQQLILVDFSLHSLIFAHMICAI